MANSFGRHVNFWNDACCIAPLMRGVNVTFDLTDRVQRLMWGRTYEPRARKCLSAILRPGDAFVDTGAHIGFFSLIASSFIGRLHRKGLCI